jgi:dipeptidyl aminopeptidase/acylaminoacyl peptidase
MSSVAFRLFACLLILISGPANPAVTAGRIPVESFAADPDVTGASLSPDGSRVAGVTSEKGTGIIFVINPDAPEKVLQRISLGKTSLQDLSWASHKRVILKVAKETSFLGMVLQVARLIVVDIDSGKVRRLDEKDPKFLATDVLHVAADGRSALVQGLHLGDKGSSVKKFDLDSGASFLVQPPVKDVWAWFVDGSGVVRGGLAREGLSWAIYYRTTANEDLTKFTGKFDKRAEDIFESVHFSPVGGETVVISNHATGRFAAYRLDLKTVQPGNLIFENPRGDIDAVVRETETGKVIGIRYHDEKWRSHWLDRDLARIQEGVDRAIVGNDNRILDFASDRNRMLILSSGAADPGVYYLLDRKKGEMKPVFARMPDIPKEALSAARSISYRARDGLTIPAFLTLPKNRPARPLPLIIFPHGGPFARDTWEFDPWVQLLANRGYAVLQPQFRGTTGFGREFAERGYGQWGRKMQDDIDDGYDWLVAQGIADPKKVCIMGGSYGGYAAIWGAIRNPERYRCAVSWAGVTDLKMMLRHDRTLFVAKRYFRDWQTRVTGVDGTANLDDVSPLKHARSLKVPLLLGHGREDNNVPVTQAEALVKALAKAQIPVEFVYYPEVGHSLYGTDIVLDWLKRVEAFVAKHNPAELPAPEAASAVSPASFHSPRSAAKQPRL